MNTPVTITKKYPGSVKADLQELLYEQRKQLGTLETGLKEQAHAVSQAYRAVSAAQHEFRTTQSEVERAKRLIESLEETISPAGVHPHSEKCAAWTRLNTAYEAVPVFYYRTSPFVEMRRRADGRLFGTVVPFGGGNGHGPFYAFAPYKTLDQNYSGPFQRIEDAMDCVNSVTPFDPDVHGWEGSMSPAPHSGFHIDA